MPSTSISTPAVTSAITGRMCGGMPGVVCSAIAVHRVDILLRYPVATQEVARGVRAVHLEALVGAAVPMRQPHVVEHRAGIEQLCIECQAAPHTGQRAPVKNAAGMVKQQRRFRVPHELRDLTRKLAVRDADSSDRDWPLRSPA